jgi:hypothetical protein
MDTIPANDATDALYGVDETGEQVPLVFDAVRLGED